MVWLASLAVGLRVLALSFNKSIAEELQKRMPSHVRSATMHSVGFGMIRHVNPRVRVDDKKLLNVIETHPGIVTLHSGTKQAVISDLLALVPLAQDMMIPADNSSLLLAAAEATGRTLEMPERSMLLVASILDAMDRMRSHITFSEMIRHPAVHADYPSDYHDLIMVDEAQDLNSSQHALLRKLVRPIKGRIIAVGDRYQSIYGFRGADPRSMDRLAADWNMRELPLDVSYRCAAGIVTEAQKIVGEETIHPRSDAPAGIVRSATLEAMAKEATEGDMVLCRINAPLITVALEFLRQGKKAVVRGRDIGSQLSGIVRRSKASDVLGLLRYVVDWSTDKVTKAIASKKSDAAIQAIQDTAATIEAIADGCDTVAEVLERIHDLFSDDRAGIVCSTVHKAKGLEAQRVWIVGPELIPAPWAKSQSEKEQERNIGYVAVTRAQHELVRVPLPPRRRD